MKRHVPPRARTSRFVRGRATRRASACVSLALAALAAAALVSGCGTTHPPPITRAALTEAQTFPYFKIYWAGPTFAGSPLAAVDGLKSYSAGIGDSVYYGDCVSGKGLLGGGGSCLLPLQVTTVIYGLHSNSSLGPQRNTLVRGVPATIYNEERSIRALQRPVGDRRVLQHTPPRTGSGQPAATPQRSRLGERQAAAAGLLPGPVGARIDSAARSDEQPSRPPLPEGTSRTGRL